MACSATTLSIQRTPVAGRAPAYVLLPVSRRQVRDLRAGALSEIDVVQNVVTSAAQIQPDVGAADPSVYMGLGLLLFSFVGTFGVAPMFRSSFKEQDSWMDIYAELTTTMGGVKSLEPEECAKMAESGAVLMDVRLAHKFDSNACPNSRSFPLYQPISGMGLAANIRRAAFTFFGVFGTERNSQWLEQVEAEVPKNQKIVVVCEHGGSLLPKTGADTGFQSQSLKAAYYLKKAGYTKVVHMKGGLAEYQRLVADLVPGEEALAY